MKIKVTIFCGDCDKDHIIKIEEISDIFGVKCPKCNGDNTWIRNVDDGCPSDDTVVLGKGGCSQK